MEREDIAHEIQELNMNDTSIDKKTKIQQYC